MRYKLSPRLEAILVTAPVGVKGEETHASSNGLAEQEKAKVALKNDIEMANGVVEKTRTGAIVETPETANHYSIASHLINYQSLARYPSQGNW